VRRGQRHLPRDDGVRRGLRILGTVTGPETHRKFTCDRETGAGIELYRNTARYITVSGLEMSHCAELPPLDCLIDTLLARHGQGQAEPLDFNTAGPQRELNYEALIENGAPEGERSELFQAVVWHLANQGRLAEQITDELAKHPYGIGAKYADRLLAEVARSYEKWRTQKQATAPTSGAAGDWPHIFLVKGELPRVVDEAEQALLDSGREVYQRGGLLMRPLLLPTIPPNDDWKLTPLTRPWLVEALTCAARFLRWDGRAKSYVPVDAPEDVAEVLLSRGGNWRLPILSGIAKTPFLRRDGSICETLGYDAASGLLYKPGDENFPPIPQQPSRDDALAALKFLDHLLDDFPFVGPADRSVALSGLLTILDRRSMTAAPLHAFTSPMAGTGKSLLVDVAAMLASDQPMPVISQGSTEEELEKRLAAALLAGDTAISLDNCEHPLQSTFLCQALTQQKLNIRMLGFSKNVETLVNAAIYATGNNLIIGGDLTRRALICSLDAHCERPELRTFEGNILDTVRTRRGRLVAAALTVLRAWHTSGARVDVPSFGSFESWSHRVREPLVWLGRTDPCETVARVREDDPKRAALLAVLIQWREVIGFNVARTVREIINIAVNYPDFLAALLTIASNRSATVVTNDRLGRWLAQNEGKIAAGLSLVRAGNTHGYPLWQLIGT
jgi:putative DNA primase/helicase